LLYAAKRMGIEDPLEARWADILARLTPLPVDHTGYKIGRDLSLEFGHRHFSHLLAVFPLHITGNSEEERQLAIRSLRHWIAKEGDLRGFSFTGAASIAAAMGLGDEALAYLRSLMHLIKPNTMYKEAGPVIETPLAGAEAIHDMLLQSWGNIIRVFPAVPETWQEAVFHNLRAEGGFLVSAVSKAGQTTFIRIQSLAGEPCRLLTDLAHSEQGFVIEVQGKRAHYILHEDRSIEIMLKSGDEAVLYAADGEEPREIAPVPAEPGMQHFFGSRKPWRLYGLLK
ncbi:glycoside hydrolase family 95-like protein, partial [Paenibacillus sp. AR247]|uniref:glycoside hydrolase family 95-like protein n=1 Tax=Paenibacillus sp. AR247 TaxID=1631599 RepID=UPI0035BE4104